MNGKQAKRARGAANAEAVSRGLWKQGEASVYAKWWRKLAARVFPRLRKRYADAVGRWYRRVLKSFARQAYASIHDPDVAAFARARAKIKRREERERTRRYFAQGQRHPGNESLNP